MALVPTVSLISSQIHELFPARNDLTVILSIGKFNISHGSDRGTVVVIDPEVCQRF